MSVYNMEDALIIRTLQDAGCDSRTISEFLQLWTEKKKDKAIRLLSCHRCNLICSVHTTQRLVDILDYFLYQIKKEQ